MGKPCSKRGVVAFQKKIQRLRQQGLDSKGIRKGTTGFGETNPYEREGGLWGPIKGKWEGINME